MSNRKRLVPLAFGFALTALLVACGDDKPDENTYQTVPNPPASDKKGGGTSTGGGTSGRGLPGGLSVGGSVGCPGVAGGISGGSIGIYGATQMVMSAPWRSKH